MISHQSWGDVAKWMGTSLASGLTHEVSRQEVPHCCPPCTFVMYLTLVTSALGVTPARILGLGQQRPAVLFGKCHRGKLELQPMWDISTAPDILGSLLFAALPFFFYFPSSHFPQII